MAQNAIEDPIEPGKAAEGSAATSKAAGESGVAAGSLYILPVDVVALCGATFPRAKGPRRVLADENERRLPHNISLQAPEAAAGVPPLTPRVHDMCTTESTRAKSEGCVRASWPFL